MAKVKEVTERYNGNGYSVLLDSGQEVCMDKAPKVGDEVKAAPAATKAERDAMRAKGAELKAEKVKKLYG